MQEGINEIIATTRLNAAPIGIICRGGNLMMSVFRTSHTAENIEEQGLIVANITHDPVLFVKTAFSDLPSEEFIKEEIEGRTVWRLKGAVSWVVYETRVDQKTEQKLLVSLTPIRVEFSDTPLIPINRGLNSIIEATVHGTRYVLTRDQKLKFLIDHHMDLVRRCGGEREFLALRLLDEYIE
ncbi:MAG: DUF447 domain-containing protein [Methanomicrobiales archaeon HGW-Methanomicrobiales-4]|nr:MAG: DUF447 domain-containing protein [Methanomicrobiales archaeon HGW-Methanomicrobiales-4]